MVKVKICGLTRAQDAELAIELGADALGFVLEPTSPRCIDPAENLWILDLGTFVPRVAVFGPIPPGAIFHPFHLIQATQFPDQETFRPRTIQTIRMKTGEGLEEFLAMPRLGEAILLDGYSKEGYGGTGHQADWTLASRITEAADRKVILAGGLNPDNVAEAIQKVHPYAVDVSSGTESSPGIKDPVKLRDFIQAARAC